MFNATKKFNQNISSWNVSAVTYMAGMFNAAEKFNQNISSWNVSAVTNMSHMFNAAKRFNQNISSWNVSAVIYMAGMFDGAPTFNQNINSWDVSAVKNMDRMFSHARVFNQNISSWSVSAVENMEGMFYGAVTFNQDINSWDVSAVENMEGMFDGAVTFNQDINSWDVSAVENMEGMFAGANAFNQNLNSWDVSAVENMDRMFSGAVTFNQDINSWDVSAGPRTMEMFAGANAFNQDLTSWRASPSGSGGFKDTSENMFENALRRSAFLRSHMNCGYRPFMKYKFDLIRCPILSPDSMTEYGGPAGAWQRIYAHPEVNFDFDGKTPESRALFDECWSSSGALKWSKIRGPTPSKGTGPTSAQSNQVYYYTEASGGRHRANQEGLLSMHCNVYTEPFTYAYLDFYYHMHGLNIGSLHVDILHKGSHASYNKRSWTTEKDGGIHGQKHATSDSEWTKVSIRLPSKGQNRGVQFRFRATLSDGYKMWSGDIAIDSVRGSPVIFCHVSFSTQRVLDASYFTCTVCF
jgi:surface protein